MRSRVSLMVYCCPYWWMFMRSQLSRGEKLPSAMWSCSPGIWALAAYQSWAAIILPRQ